MSYQVLARRWRPRSFQELVGQEHVVRALVNALNNNRLHHAFLFTGTRGVGKTTIARILAKSLNCEQGVSAQPCGQCGACQEIDQGRFVDLLEVDAASRTKVEDTRELLENVQYAPTSGRYKVYLIDEVHMLSGHSFNALLKTLEEPPPHVKFLLATTDPQRLPVTVLSRCLQFNLKRLPVALIAGQLKTILEKEGIPAEDSALDLIAQAGDGSMRDALSLLDQAIAFAGGHIKLEDAREMLGGIDQDQVLGLLQALTAGDASALLQRVEELDQMAPDYATVLAELIVLLQRLALIQVVPGVEDEDASDPQILRRLAADLKPEDVQLFYQIALLGRRDLPLSPDARGGFEMILLRMLCFQPAGLSSRSPNPPPAAASSPQSSSAAKPATPEVAEKPTASSVRTESDWNSIVGQLGLKGMTQQLALNSVLQKQEDGNLRLLLDAKHSGMRTRNAEERLQKALSSYYGKPIRLSIRLTCDQPETPAREQAQQQEQRRQAAIEAINRDPNVQALCETFDAKIKPDSIRPID